MTKPHIYYTKPSITEQDVSLANGSLRNSWDVYSDRDIYLFEEAFVYISAFLLFVTLL